MTASSPPSPQGFRPRALGEVAIRCDDLGRMTAFYEGVIGLTRLKGNSAPQIVFYGLGESTAGHTAVLALFDRALDAHRPGGGAAPVTGAGSALHHVALSLPRAEQDAAIAWFERTGQPFRIEHFGWIGWRGVFLTDPEGNTVELVAYDRDFLAPQEASRRASSAP